MRPGGESAPTPGKARADVPCLVGLPLWLAVSGIWGARCSKVHSLKNL